MVSRLVAATEAGGAETTSVARALLAECLLEPVCAPTPVPKPIVDFWATNTFEPEVMAALDISKPRLSASGRVNRFVSHCWAAPSDYAEQTIPAVAAARKADARDGMKDMSQRNYSKAKASELQQAGRKVAAEMFGSESEWDKVTCWIDKVCIPQNDEAKKRLCVEHIEDFLRLSDGLIVLLSWNYFERLWCLYEWACFLVSHPATAVTVRLVPFPNLDNFSLWLSAVSNVSVQNAKCFLEADREILLQKVGQYYRGKSLDECCESFQRFVQFTACALLAVQAVSTATSERLLNIWFTPWMDLAKKLNFPKLVRALGQLTAPSDRRPDLPVVVWWNMEALELADAALFHRRVAVWFAREVFPLLEEEKARAVRPEAVRRLSAGKIVSPLTSALDADPVATTAAQRFFRNLDHDRSSFVDKQEFRRVHEKFMGRKGGLKLKPWLYASSMDEIFRKIDLHEDGRIDEEEWRYYASAVLETLGRVDFLRLLNSTD
jgi:hypothetical protein